MSEKVAIIVDGFQRSGNTFLTTALQMAFAEQIVTVRMHHNPACVLNQYDGVPFITPVREPLGTCVSTARQSISHDRNPSADKNLTEYTRYLENIASNGERLYIARFTDLVKDVSSVIDGLVGSYPQLAALNRSPTSNEEVIEMVNRGHRRGLSEEKWAARGHVPRPSSTNNEELLLELLDPDRRELLTKAHEAYWKVLQLSYMQ